MTIICVRRRPGEPATTTDMPDDISARFDVWTANQPAGAPVPASLER